MINWKANHHYKKWLLYSRAEQNKVNTSSKYEDTTNRKSDKNSRRKMTKLTQPKNG